MFLPFLEYLIARLEAFSCATNSLVNQLHGTLMQFPNSLDEDLGHTWSSDSQIIIQIGWFYVA